MPGLIKLGLALLAMLVACASTSGASPHDMSVAGHESAAREEEKKAAPGEAAAHRAAAEALRGEEAWACAGIAEADRDASPLRPEVIESVSRLEDTTISTKTGPPHRLVGAVISVRAAPGLTGEWLQRSIHCHVARIALRGNDPPGMEACPFAPGDLEVRVSSSGEGFRIELRASTAKVAEEILRRAQVLAAQLK